MKKILLFIGLIPFHKVSFAQNTFPSNGDVLIGTTVDDNQSKLQVNGGIAIGSNDENGLISLFAQPNIPLSTRLQDFSNTSMGAVFGGDLLLNNFWGVAININKGLLNDNNNNAPCTVIPNTSSFTINSFISSDSLKTLFVVRNNGNTGIGTTSPQSKLAVNGTITATQVKVTQTGWSDFVFDSAYHLPVLSKTDAFIKTNHHLPGIPSAKEIESNGLDLGSMEQKQMQKIEELTLYQINADKRIQQLEKEVSQLKSNAFATPTQMSSIEVNAGLNNQSSRPAVSPGTIAGEIRGISGVGTGMDDGFLRLSAGGGTNWSVKSYIDLSGYNYYGTGSDMYQNIVFGTSGSEAMRIKYDHSIIAKSSITAGSFIKAGGNSSQFLKADGSIDGTTYLPVSGGNITGNLGIGTTSPQSKLAVNGTVTATEVKVTQTGWPDFVFDSAYHLPALSNTAAFIKANHRLPGIPSTKEIESNGLDLGSMEQKQMQKIEELTLYVIKLEKKYQQLEQNMKMMEHQNHSLEKQLKTIRLRNR